jgi:hypothetical protein
MPYSACASSFACAAAFANHNVACSRDGSVRTSRERALYAQQRRATALPHEQAEPKRARPPRSSGHSHASPASRLEGRRCRSRGTSPARAAPTARPPLPPPCTTAPPRTRPPPRRRPSGPDRKPDKQARRSHETPTHRSIDRHGAEAWAVGRDRPRWRRTRRQSPYAACAFAWPRCQPTQNKPLPWAGARCDSAKGILTCKLDSRENSTPPGTSRCSSAKRPAAHRPRPVRSLPRPRPARRGEAQLDEQPQPRAAAPPGRSAAAQRTARG